jgi:hypothetical protein
LSRILVASHRKSATLLEPNTWTEAEAASTKSGTRWAATAVQNQSGVSNSAFFTEEIIG